MAHLTAHEFPLSKVFSSDYQFSIPDYQRPYSWRNEQALQLVADLKDALDRDEDLEPYFLGSIVLVKAEGDANADVIDGQQRLTTLTILLAVLRSLTSSKGLEESLQKMITEPGDELLDLVPRPRLQLRPRDRDFFEKYVQSGDLAELMAVPTGSLKTDAQANIRDNVVVLHETLSEWDEKDLVGLARLLGQRTYLVVVSTPDLSSAHRIFSVMNSRGMDLSAADIFKARVIGAFKSEEERESYGTRWEDAEELLGRQAFQDLFLHIRMIFAKTRAQREILQEFPVQVLDAFLPARAAEFVDQVVLPYAEKFSIIQNESYAWPTGADEVNRWLHRLNQVDNNDWKPVALWLLRTHSEDPATLSSHLAHLERIAAAMLIRRAYATPRATRFANLLRSLEGGDGLDSAEYSLDEFERLEVLRQLQSPIYGIAPIRKYVLLRLNEQLASAPVVFEPRIISVEHVLPQSPAADSTWAALFDDSQHRKWVHRLANLVLLDKRKNSEAQNFEFEKKKDKYFRSASGVTPFSLTLEVLDATSWTPEDLAMRQSRLVRILARMWNLTDSADGSSLTDLTDSELAVL